MTSRSRFLLTMGFFLYFHSPESQAKFIPSYAGPYTAFVEKWYQCEPNESDGSGVVQFRPSYYRPHYKGFQTITGNCSWRTEFNDTFWLKVKLDLWNSNQWKENALILRFPSGACRQFRDNFPGYYLAVFGPVYGKPSVKSSPCAIRAGTYPAENAPVDWNSPNIPVLPYGVYRFTMYSGLKQYTVKPKLCTVMELNISPKIT